MTLTMNILASNDLIEVNYLSLLKSCHRCCCISLVVIQIYREMLYRLIEQVSMASVHCLVIGEMVERSIHMVRG